jgi:hypothetical protein
MTDYLNLKGFDNIFSTTLNNEIQDNIVEFIDWALLEKGNYFNVTLDELSPESGNYSILKLSTDVNYASGTCYESFRKNWVWQSGISYDPAPIVGTNNSKPGISGIYLNNIFYPTTTSGQYEYKIDYYNGRVIFNNPTPSGSVIKAEYSYKYVNIIYANSLPWLREIQYRTLDLQPANNEFTLPAESRVQLPAVAVEIVPRRSLKGYQLGGGQIVDTDIIFHCLAEDEFTRNKLVDIISLQNDKKVYMFDSNLVASGNEFPINAFGTPVSGALRYPELITKYNRGSMWLKNSTVQAMDLINSNFYAGIVRLTAEIIEYPI